MNDLVKYLKRTYDNKIAQFLAEVGLNYIYLGVISIIIGVVVTIIGWESFCLVPLTISFIIYIFCYMKAIKYLKEAEIIEMQEYISENICDIEVRIMNIQKYQKK